MSEIEKTLKQQLSRTALQKKVCDAHNALMEKRFQLIGMATALAMVQSGFSDGEDCSPDDDLRACCLGRNEVLFDQLAKELVGLKAKHQKLHRQLVDFGVPNSGVDA